MTRPSDQPLSPRLSTTIYWSPSFKFPIFLKKKLKSFDETHKVQFQIAWKSEKNGANFSLLLPSPTYSQSIFQSGRPAGALFGTSLGKKAASHVLPSHPFIKQPVFICWGNICRLLFSASGRYESSEGKVLSRLQWWEGSQLTETMPLGVGGRWTGRSGSSGQIKACVTTFTGSGV